MQALQQALAQERARKEPEMKAQAAAIKREAIETARWKVAEEKAKNEAELRALEAKKVQLQQQREREAAGAHGVAERRAPEATIAAMGEARRKIRHKTPPGGSRVDTLRRFFDGDPASRTKIDLDAEDAPTSGGSGPASRPRRKGKRKPPEGPQRPAERYPHDSDPLITCSDGDGRDRRHRHEPAGCKVGAPGVSGGGGGDTPQSSGGEGPTPPYRSRESTPGEPAPRSELRWGDMDVDEHRDFGPDTGPSSSGGPPDGGLPGPPGAGRPRGPPGAGPPGRPPYGGQPDRGPPAGLPGVETPDKPPGAGIPEDILQWIVYLKRRIWVLEREVQINQIDIGTSAAVTARTQLNIAKFKAGKLSGVVTKLQRMLAGPEDLRRDRSDRPPPLESDSDDSLGPGPDPPRSWSHTEAAQSDNAPSTCDSA